MAIFKVTLKKLILSGGKRMEAGMSAEIPFNGSVLPFTNSQVKAELKRQFKTKYNVDYPDGYINGGSLDVKKM